MKKTRKQLIREGKHLCHWPTCTNPVPPSLWGCKFHWFKLPKRLRDRIWHEYVPGQEKRRDPSSEYIDVAVEVDRWIKKEIKASREV